jgi:hypothetical protein
MKISVIATLIFISFCCGGNSTTHSNNFNTVKHGHKVEANNYSVNSIPAFFEAVVNEHMNELKIIDSTLFEQLCTSNYLDHENPKNIKYFYTLSFLHKFFTCQNAGNGSRGGIINIPYYWHWVNPNPRHEIILNTFNIKLNDVKPPTEFSKYKSFADIDRTPFLFLSELFLDKPKYYSTLCDTFSTFGWCSEREMAFVCLLDILGYKGKVIAENNHSWSEFIIPMNNNKKETQQFKVTVDNTFDLMDWNKISSNEVNLWNAYQGQSKQANWYNLKAHSEKEKEQISLFPISNIAIKRIEHDLVEYFDRAINER